MLTKAIHIGSERGHVCKISKAIFGEKEHGSLEAARRAALRHCCSIIKQQTADGIPRSSSIKQRRKIYKSAHCI